MSEKIKLNQEEWDKEKNRVRDWIEDYTRFMWERFFKTYQLNSGDK